MNKKILILLALLLPLGCAAPQYIIPQKDMAFQQVNPPDLEKKILIASRKSQFKDAVVQKIKQAFENRNVYMKITGIENLQSEDPHAYGAVVLINTCMGWTIDKDVERFLKKYGDLDSIIVLTTSDGGDISPDMKNRKIDAITAASMKEEVDPTADGVIARINRLLEM